MTASSCPEPPPISPPQGLSSRRYLALWFPFLSTDRARRSRTSPGERPDERPFALVEKERGALRLVALDAAAARSGLRVGMALAEARALLPQLLTLEAHPAADADLLRSCAEACEMFTPLVALRGPDGLVLDVTGCVHLFGGEEAMLQRARRRMAAFGLTACAALAGTPDAAWAFARYRRNRVAAPGEDETLARDLPLQALDADSETTLALSRAGFRSLADLAERPSRLLAARFGSGLVERLYRVLGWEDIRLTPLRPLPDIVAEKHFPEPLGHVESLLGVLERLARDVAGPLERRGTGGRAFEASFFRSDGAVRRITMETGAPLRDPATIVRLVKLRIEALADPLDPGFGFDALRLGVLRSEAFAPRQKELDGRDAQADQDRALAALIDRLVARFGRENVRRFIARDTHDPVLAGGTISSLSTHPGASWPEPETGQPPARPLTLFTHPQPIEVLAEVPDSPPLRFRWRRMLHEVTRAEGPERIAPEWWREASPAPATRDYYRIEDQAGHRFWIFREGLYEDRNTQPRWFLHGLFP
ncbi:MAG: nucleotidyltransferase [Methylobacterium sp.]|nr:MAG: nucleotidyltransferase [Methylobacterium sp.]